MWQLNLVRKIIHPMIDNYILISWFLIYKSRYLQEINIYLFLLLLLLYTIHIKKEINWSRIKILSQKFKLCLLLTNLSSRVRWSFQKSKKYFHCRRLKFGLWQVLFLDHPFFESYSLFNTVTFGKMNVIQKYNLSKFIVSIVDLQLPAGTMSLSRMHVPRIHVPRIHVPRMHIFSRPVPVSHVKRNLLVGIHRQSPVKSPDIKTIKPQ